jgi:uncharacterized protein (UPF0335 family)
MATGTYETTSTTWYTWATTSVSAYNTATASAWSNWTTGTSSTADTVWYRWTVDYNTASYLEVPNSVLLNYRVLTEEEQQADEKRRKEQEAYAEQQRKQMQERIERLCKEKEAAEEKAKQLLLDLIGEAELKVYEETGRLFVKGKKHDYIVQKQGYVKCIEKDVVTDLCVHLQDRASMPDTDNVIALKVMLEHNEDHVLRLANKHGSRKEELPRAACM